MIGRLGYLTLFWAMQVGANVLFKYGAKYPDKYWLGFIGGNLLGASSIFVMIWASLYYSSSTICAW